MRMYRYSYCPICGAEAVLDELFCAKDGARLERMKIPHCMHCWSKGQYEPLAEDREGWGMHANYCQRCGLPYEKAINFRPQTWWGRVAAFFRRPF